MLSITSGADNDDDMDNGQGRERRTEHRVCLQYCTHEVTLRKDRASFNLLVMQQRRRYSSSVVQAKHVLYLLYAKSLHSPSYEPIVRRSTQPVVGMSSSDCKAAQVKHVQVKHVLTQPVVGMSSREIRYCSNPQSWNHPDTCPFILMSLELTITLSAGLGLGRRCQ